MAVPVTVTDKDALAYLRRLIAGGLAGLDAYDHDTFIVDCGDQDLRDRAEIALDALRATFLRDDRRHLRCVLPRWVAAELDLYRRDPPTVVTALASRRASRPPLATVTDNPKGT